MDSAEFQDRRFHFYLVQAVTVARAPLAVAFAGVLLWGGQSTSVLIACAVLLLAAEMTDAADGFLARRLGVVSQWGATLDPYVDSVFRMIVYWALGWAGLALGLTVLVMAVRDVTVAYCRILLTRRGRSVAARWSGKLKAIVQGVAGFVLLAGPFYWPLTGPWTVPAVSWLVIVTTALSAVEYIAAAVSEG